MLTVVSGSYAQLEKEFLSRIRELKQEPFSKIAVVAPSVRLRDYLQRLMSRSDLPALNIHFHTFNSLARDVVAFAEPLQKPVSSDTLLYDTLVKMILKEDRPFQDFQDLAVPEGFPPAVRSTLRDLMDAGVPENVGLKFKEALEDKIFATELGLGQLMDLFRLYGLYSKRLDQLPVLPSSALIRQAIDAAPTSPFLSEFKEILYYGFYDLTGNQADFFQTVVKHHPAQFFFPYLHENPNYVFASRFRDTFLQPVISHEKKITNDVAEPKSIASEILSISGQHDEAWIVAREILRLHQDENIPYEKMAVVARNRERFTNHFLPIFDEQRIPIQSTVKATMASHPLVARALEILEASNLSEGKKMSWTLWGQKVKALLQKTDHLLSDETASAWEAMSEGIESLNFFDKVFKSISFSEYLETLRDRWFALPQPNQRRNGRGVSLLHAEAARGLFFEVVFLVGLEPKVFPRIIREDPFLRDDARFAISSMLGYKIGQKSLALEEEKLLFHLLTESATKKLYLLYQRSDADGAVVGMSPYLRMWAAEKNIDLESAVQIVPRPYNMKLRRSSHFTLSQRDLLIRFLMDDDQSSALDFAKRRNLPWESLGRGLVVRQALQEFSGPGVYDGLLDSKIWKPYFSALVMSPTALETFSECGFRYFSNHILDVEPLEEKSEPEKFDVRVRGTMVHLFFEMFFKEWNKKNTESLFEKLFEEIFSVQKAVEIPIHSVLWEAIRMELKVQMKQCLLNDLAFIETNNWVPTYFEHPLEAQLPAPLNEVAWGGRADRIDVAEGAIRIVDYKSGRNKTKDVLRSILSGKKVQPSIYILLAEQYFQKLGKPLRDFSFSYLFLKGPAIQSDLTAADWAKNRQAVVKILGQQIEKIKTGDFSLTVGPWCDYCDYDSLCRKQDSISVYRVMSKLNENPNN